MLTHKSWKQIGVLCAFIAGALVIAVLLINGAPTENGEAADTGSDTDTGSNASPQYFTLNDVDGGWDMDGAVRITLCEDSGTISGNGAAMSGKDLIISAPGHYIVSGELSDGSMIVEADDDAKIWILLDGVKIYCSDNAAIRVNNADKVFLTLAENSENFVESGTEYSSDALEDGTDGVIFAHDDLTVNGSGTLTVSGGYKHGIAANDDFIITGGTILVSSVVDAVHVNDRLNMKDASLTLTAGDDGIAVEGESGSLYIESGTFHIVSADDGIHVGTDIVIQGGSFEIKAGDDGIHSDTAVAINGGTILVSECYEGIEAQTIDIKDGEITIYCLDDGINASNGNNSFDPMGGNGNMRPNGGMHPNGDGGMRPNGNMQPNGNGNMQPNDNMQPNGGTRPNGGMQPPSGNYAQPDIPQEPVNGEPPHGAGVGDDFPEGDAFGQNEDFPMGQPGNQMNADTSAILPTVIISGGKIVIMNSQGQDADGIDSNGDILISGGEVYISLNGRGANCALDYGSENGGTCKIDGGIVVAAGGSAMLEKISPDSEQASMVCITNGDAASLVVLADADGETIVSHEIPLEFTAVTISCPELKTGNAYTLSIGNVSGEIMISETAGTYHF